MRSTRAKQNLFAVSAYARETAINTEKATDVSMMIAIGDVINPKPITENNANEATGLEEVDQIYNMGQTVEASVNFEKMQPQHAAFIMAYALGSCSSAAAGAGYQHTITPIAGDLDDDRSNPSFTGMQRLGNSIIKKRLLSLFVDGFTLSAAKGEFVKLSADIKGTGKVVQNITEETVNAAGNSTTLTLAANAVQGSTAAARLDSIHRIRAEVAAGVWTEVTFSAVSSATPAAITITAPAGGTATLINFKVLYVPTEDAAFTFPARIQETPLRISEMSLIMGGAWSGTAFAGGRTVSSEIEDFSWKFANGGNVEFRPGAGGAYASSYFRDGRDQSISIGRKMKEAIMQNAVTENEEFGLRVLFTGAEIDGSHNYEVEVIYPLLAVMSADPSVDGKVVNESVELQIMEHATYGSVIARVKNLQAAYAA